MFRGHHGGKIIEDIERLLLLGKGIIVAVVFDSERKRVISNSSTIGLRTHFVLIIFKG
jgi:hypothetical protein